MTPLTTEELVIRYLHEVPNEAAAAAALVLLAIIAVALTTITIKTRTFYMLTVAITAFLEMVGYATHVAMLHNPSLNGFIIHQALLIIPPVLLAIVEYITISRLLALSNPSGAPSRFSKTVSWLFTCSNVFCLLLQTTGGGMYANPSTMDTARTLLLAGLGAQLGFFTIFTCIAIHVHSNRKFGYRGDRQFTGLFVCL
jgi:hypothetical protein